jgi:thiamine biosynthesis protein ThiS
MPSVPRPLILQRMTPVDTGEQTLSITVNGTPRTAPAGATLADLLRALELDPRLIVVERNAVILRDRANFDAVALQDDDVLELVHFVGGG